MHRGNLGLQSYGTGNLEIREAIDLGFAEQVGFKGVDVLLFQSLINIDDMLQLLEEPLVNLRQIVNLINGILRQVHGF